MSKMVYNTDKAALAAEVLTLEVEGYICKSADPSWNEFGKCWIMMMEKYEVID